MTVTSGSATFKADLRLRVQAGAEASIDLFGIGAGAVVGIFANIIEFVAVIETTPTCPLETEIFWDLNVGAFAHLDVSSPSLHSLGRIYAIRPELEVLIIPPGCCGLHNPWPRANCFHNAVCRGDNNQLLDRSRHDDGGGDHFGD